MRVNISFLFFRRRGKFGGRGSIEIILNVGQRLFNGICRSIKFD